MCSWQIRHTRAIFWHSMRNQGRCSCSLWTLPVVVHWKLSHHYSFALNWLWKRLWRWTWTCGNFQSICEQLGEFWSIIPDIEDGVLPNYRVTFNISTNWTNKQWINYSAALVNYGKAELLIELELHLKWLKCRSTIWSAQIHVHIRPIIQIAI